MGHLGERVSALLDGQLSAAETERAWDHVHGCHQCRDLVEREGWVKTRLASLTLEPGSTPSALRGALVDGLTPAALEPAPLTGSAWPRPRSGVVVWGSGALGAAVVGIVALGIAPADRPPLERRTPVTSLVTPAPGPSVRPALGPTVSARPTPASPTALDRGVWRQAARGTMAP